MSVNDGGPAHPIHELRTRGTIEDGDVEYVVTHSGLSLRDWFAGQVVGAVLSNKRAGKAFGIIAGPGSTESVAKFCYSVADAMLTERNKGERNV